VSRKVRRAIVTLEQEAAIRVHIVRRLLGEYRELVLSGANQDLPHHVRKQREMDRVIAEYVKLQKKLKRLRRRE
jgi:hypothetical protein